MFTEFELKEYALYKKKLAYYSRQAVAMGLPKEEPYPKDIFINRFIRGNK